MRCDEIFFLFLLSCQLYHSCCHEWCCKHWLHCILGSRMGSPLCGGCPFGFLAKKTPNCVKIRRGVTPLDMGKTCCDLIASRCGSCFLPSTQRSLPKPTSWRLRENKSNSYVLDINWLISILLITWRWKDVLCMRPFGDFDLQLLNWQAAQIQWACVHGLVVLCLVLALALEASFFRNVQAIHT